MQVNKTIQTENGPVTFNAELAQDELDFVIEVGLNVLLANGAVPFIKHSDFAAGSVTGEVGNA